MLKEQTVLVIDNDPAVCALLKRQLVGPEVGVITTCDPRDGLERARRGVDLVLLDVQLPVIDGFEVCRRLKSSEATAETPVIFLTGSDDPSQVIRAFEVGGQDYLTKPFNELELRARVRSALRIRALLQERSNAEKENRRLVANLRERVKEMRTLNLVSTVLQNMWIDLPRLFQNLVELLPPGWTEPDNVVARLSFDDREYFSRPIDLPPCPAQRSHFRISDGREGLIEVIYVGDTQREYEHDLFLEEEQELLHTVAEMLEHYLDRRVAAESKSRLISIIEATTDFVATADLSGRMHFINGAGRRMLGLGSDEPIESTVLTNYAPEWALRIILHQGIPQAIRDGVWSGTTALLTQDGREIPVSQLLIVHKDADGVPQFLSSIARDMTDQHEVERVLRANEAEIRAQREVLQSVLSHIPFAVYWKDRSQVYQGCNAAFARDAGVEHVDRVIGRTDEDLPWPAPEMQNRRMMDEEVLVAGEALLNVEHASELADGRTATLLVSRVPLRDADGAVVGLLGIHADISDRKRAEVVLRENEAKLNAMTSQLPAILWTTDRDLQITSMRGAGLASFDVDPRRLLGVSLIDLIEQYGGDVSNVRRAHSRALLGKSASYEFRFGDSAFEVRVEPLLDEQRAVVGCLGIAIDVTERKRAEEMERDRRSLRDAVRAMEQVLGVIGHELRTPLAGLRVISELLLGEDHLQSEQAAGFLRSINDEAIRLSEMVDNMLEAARVNSGAGKWIWSTVPLAPVCHEVAEIMRPVFAERDVALTLKLDLQPEELTMQGDRDAVRRLLLNLISNAQKHTRFGSVDLRLRSERDSAGRWILFEVVDTGEGIDGRLTDRLGVPFALSAGTVGQSQVQGSGLGLAICKGIASAHGGCIEIESTPGAGTTVRVRLRADLPGPAPSDEVAAATLIFREVAA